MRAIETKSAWLKFWYCHLGVVRTGIHQAIGVRFFAFGFQNDNFPFGNIQGLLNGLHESAAARFIVY